LGFFRHRNIRDENENKNKKTLNYFGVACIQCAYWINNDQLKS